MATIFTHPLVPVAVGLIAGSGRVPPRLMFWASIAAVLPDTDVIAFNFGVPYGSDFGHRGFTHSAAFAIFIGLIGAVAHKGLEASRGWAFLMLFIGSLSHPFLDAFTNGGRGVAILWPLDGTRYFFPWTPIEVSPIGGGFFSARGLDVLVSEFMWVVMPLLVIATLGRYVMRKFEGRTMKAGGK